MKDFTTADYINPIIGYFKAFYTPVKDRRTLEALNCTVLLKKNRVNEYKAIRANEPLYTFNNPVKELYAEVADYAEYASTEPGELDEWRYNEEERIQAAIRDRLIEIYA